MGANIGVVQKFTGIQKLGQKWWWSNGIRVEYLRRIQYVAAQSRSQRLRLNGTQEIFTGRIIFMSIFDDISWWSKDNMRECDSNAQLVSLIEKNSEQDNGHSSDLDRKKSGILSVKIVHKVNGTKWQKRWWWHSQKADTQSFEPRVHRPDVSSRAKAVENGRSTVVPTRTRLQLFFAQLFSVNQLSLYGAGAEMSQEYKSFHHRIGKPVVGGQSPSVIKTNVPLNSDNPAHKELLLQRYGEWIKKVVTTRQIELFFLGCRILECCWIRTVFHDERCCRILTIPCSMSWVHSAKRRRNVWPERCGSEGTTKIGPVLEVTTCCLQGKYGVEIRN